MINSEQRIQFFNNYAEKSLFNKFCRISFNVFQFDKTKNLQLYLQIFQVLIQFLIFHLIEFPRKPFLEIIFLEKKSRSSFSFSYSSKCIFKSNSELQNFPNNGKSPKSQESFQILMSFFYSHTLAALEFK